MKVSKKQQDILDKMRNGWELGGDLGLNTHYRIQQSGLGRGGESEMVSYSTVSALLRMGLIQYGERRFPIQRFNLTP